MNELHELMDCNNCFFFNSPILIIKQTIKTCLHVICLCMLWLICFIEVNYTLTFNVRYKLKFAKFFVKIFRDFY